MKLLIDIVLFAQIFLNLMLKNETLSHNILVFQDIIFQFRITKLENHVSAIW